MRAISLETLKELNQGGFMLRCCLCADSHVQYHHNLIYGGRQVDEAWTILPVCVACHLLANSPQVRDKLDWIMCNRATPAQLLKYSKIVDWAKRRDKLNAKFGKYDNA